MAYTKKLEKDEHAKDTKRYQCRLHLSSVDQTKIDTFVIYDKKPDEKRYNTSCVNHVCEESQKAVSMPTCHVIVVSAAN